MRDRRTTGLRSRTLLLVFLAVAPAFGLIVYNGVVHRHQAVERAGREALQTARDAASDQQHLVDGARLLLEASRHLPEVIGHDPIRCSATVGTLVRSQPAYANLGAIDIDGKVFCSAASLPPGVNVADRLYFRLAVRTKAFAIGEYQIGRITHEPTINVALPILNRRGAVDSVVFAAIRLTSLIDAASQAELPKGSAIIVIDQAGRILARHPDAQRWVGKPFPAALVSMMKRDGDGLLRGGGADGVTRLYGYTTLPGTSSAPVSILVGVPEGVAYAETNKVLLVDLIGLGFVTLLGALAAMLGTERLVLGPVRVLRSAARRLAAGELTARADLPKSRGELQDLASAFDEMAATLQRQLTALRYQALHDSLTGLPNAASLERELGYVVRAGRRREDVGALLLVSLDHFGDISNTLGPGAADVAINEAARRLRSVVREGDLAARVGGYDLAVLLKNGDESEALEAASRIGARFDEAFVLGDFPLDLRASIGVARFVPHADPNEMVRRAEVAVAEARRTRALSALYRESDDVFSQKRLRLVSDLRTAASRRELALVYQPKVHVRTGRAAGVEALLRWNHPDLGQVAPATFIPLAEEFDLMKALTGWALAEALAQHDVWRRHNLFMPVAVNLSVRDLQDRELPSMIARLLKDNDAIPGSLEVEITESIAMIEPERSIELLRELSRMGIRLAIDDFGTGHSSLAYLTRLPVDVVKIDRSFVVAMGSESDAAHVVRSAIELAHDLGKEVVAEGVEDRATFEALAGMACDYIQGFYASRPVGADELERLAKKLTFVPGAAHVDAI